MEVICQKCSKPISNRARANVMDGMTICTPCQKEVKSAIARHQNLLRMIGKAFTPWTVRDGSRQIGPFPTAHLIELLRRGAISWDVEVQREGMKGWTPVARLFTIPELADGRLELREFGQGDGTYRPSA